MGRAGIRRVVMESLEEIIYGKLSMERSFESKNFTIHVQRVEGVKLINPIITFKSSNGGQNTLLNAAEAEIHAHPNLIR